MQLFIVKISVNVKIKYYKYDIGNNGEIYN